MLCFKSYDHFLFLQRRPYGFVTHWIMALCSLLALTSLYAQSQTVADTDCDYRQLLDTYRTLDDEEQLQDAEILHSMALTAKRAEEDSLATYYFNRIQESEVASSDEKAHALIDMLYYKIESVSYDSIKRNIQDRDDLSTDLFHLLEVTKMAGELNKNSKSFTDSTFLSSIQSIANVERYSFNIIYNLTSWSRYLSRESRYAEAFQASQRAVRLSMKYQPWCSKTNALAYFSLGRRYIDLGRLDSARLSLDISYNAYSAIKPLQSASKMQVALALAETYEGMYEMDAALQFLDSADVHAQSDSTLYLDILPRILNRKGNIFGEIGKLERAKEYYLRSLELADKSPNKLQRVASYTNISNQLILLNEFQKAQEYLSKALEICTELVGENHPYTAIILMKLGDVNYHLDNYSTTEELYNQSLAIRKKIYGNNHPTVSNAHTNYAVYYRDTEQYAQALDQIDKAIVGYKTAHGPQSQSVAGAYNRRASIHLLQGANDLAMKDIKRAKQALACRDNYKSCNDIQLYLDLLEKEMHVRLSHSKEQKAGNDSTLIIGAHGYAIFKEGIRVAESSEDIARMVNNFSSFYRKYIHALVSEYLKNGNKSELYLAYQLVGQLKNLALLQVLRERRHLLNAPGTIGLHSKSKTLKHELIVEEKKLFGEKLNRQKEDSILLQIVNLQDSIDIIQQEIYRIAPTLEPLNTLPPLQDIAKLLKELTEGDVLIDYLLVDSALLTFALTRDTMIVQADAVNWTLAKDELKSYNETLLQRELFEEKTPKIFDLLQEHLTEYADANKIIKIIPDQFLSEISFDLILAPQDSLSRISYANSVSILEEQRVKNKRPNKYPISIFAPDYESENQTLRYSQIEANQIADLYQDKAQIFLTNVKDAFLSKSQESDILHLTMHAELNSDHPLNTQFVFGDDENLHLYELYTMESTAQLAVLSACETGVGRVHDGAGVRSLANGFQYSGVPAVVMSLWKVPDATTAEIMTAFYKHLRAGQPKDMALQRAKQDYKKSAMTEKLLHPFYWAGFVLVGNTSPIKHKSTPNILLWMALTILTLGTIIYFLSKKKWLINTKRTS